MSFGESLVGIRKSKGISRKDLAEQLEIPYTTLRNYETDQREPGHKILIKMAGILNVSVDKLVGYCATSKKAPSVSDEAMKLAQDYDEKMDDWGRKQVRDVADNEIARCSADWQTKAEAVRAERERTSREAAAEIKPPTPVSKDEQCLDEIALTVFQGLNPGQKQQYIDLMQGETELAKS